MDRAPPASIFLAPITVLYLVFLITPLSLFLVMGVFKYDPFDLYKPVLTSANFERLLLDRYYLLIILRTVQVAALTTVVCLLLAYPLALFLTRTRSAARGILLFLIVAPLMTGVIVRTYGWIILLGTDGLINNGLILLRLTTTPVQILNTQLGVVIALVHILLPYMVFPLFSALAAQDPDLERAADTLGAGPIRSFLEITLPLSRQGIMMGSVLVFTLAAGAVATPTLIGGKNVQMMGQTIYGLVLSALNWPLASAMAFLLVGLQFVIIWVYLSGGRRGNAR